MSNLLQQQMTDNFSFKSSTAIDDVLANTDGKTVYTKSVAQYLHDTRIYAKLSLADIANKLRISQHYLQAIEDCNLEVLPERVYTLGFIRSYAKHLGLNGEEIVKRFKNEILGEESLNTTYVATKLNEESSLPSRSLMYAISALLVLGAIGSWLYTHVFSTSNSQPTPMPEVIKSEIQQSVVVDDLPPSITVQDAVTPPSVTQANTPGHTENLPVNPQLATQAPTASDVSRQSAVAADTITLSFIELTWIEVKDAHGKIMVSKDINSGEIYEIIPQEGMRFSTGNAGGITVKRAGQADFVMGKHGEIIKNITFNSQRFIKP